MASQSGLSSTPMVAGVNEKASEDCVTSQVGHCAPDGSRCQRKGERGEWRREVGHCVADGSLRRRKGEQGECGIVNWAIVLPMGASANKKASEESALQSGPMCCQWKLVSTKRRARRVASQSWLFVPLMGSSVDGLEIGMTSGNTCNLVQQ